jgi:hypothetical protein
VTGGIGEQDSKIAGVADTAAIDPGALKQRRQDAEKQIQSSKFKIQNSK